MSDLVHRLEAASTLCVAIDSKDVITQILCHAHSQSRQHPVGFFLMKGMRQSRDHCAVGEHKASLHDRHPKFPGPHLFWILL